MKLSDYAEIKAEQGKDIYDIVSDYMSHWRLKQSDIDFLESAGYKEEDFIEYEWRYCYLDGTRVDYQIAYFHNRISIKLFGGSMTIDYDNGGYDEDDVINDIMENYYEYRDEDMYATYCAFAD